MPERDNWGLVPTADLRSMAEGCTELTCIYHGAINAELRRRAAHLTTADQADGEVEA